MEKIANIVMWVIAGAAALFGIIFGVGITITMISIHPGDYFGAFAVGLGLMLFVALIDFTFVSIFKLVLNSLFYSSIVGDYKKRKRKGESNDKY
jgi:membrane protein implicated in regulation of membrane protease activity